jgi:hypothetical protein
MAFYSLFTMNRCLLIICLFTPSERKFFVLDASYLIFKIAWKRNKDEWFSVTSQRKTMFSYAALKTVKLAEIRFIKEMKVDSSYTFT